MKKGQRIHVAFDALDALGAFGQQDREALRSSMFSPFIEPPRPPLHTVENVGNTLTEIGT